MAKKPEEVEPWLAQLTEEIAGDAELPRAEAAVLRATLRVVYETGRLHGIQASLEILVR